MVAELVLGMVLLFLLGLAGAVLVIFLIVFWILMLIDAIQRKFKNDSDKIVWIIVLVFLQLLGAIIYYFIVKKNAK